MVGRHTGLLHHLPLEVLCDYALYKSTFTFTFTIRQEDNVWRWRWLFMLFAAVPNIVPNAPFALSRTVNQI